MTSFHDQLSAAFPNSTDANLVRTVSQGILLAKDVMENERFLASLIGGDIKGHIRRAAVLFNIHESCTAGDLPFKSEMSRMPLGGGHWVELHSGSVRAHVCRTDGPNGFPEDTPTRQDQRLSNQLELNLSPVVVPLIPLPEERYAWLTFGAAGAELTHLCWAMPEAGKNNWLARINVLQRLGTATEVPVETPSSVVTLRFRDHIEEALSKEEGREDRTS